MIKICKLEVHVFILHLDNANQVLMRFLKHNFAVIGSTWVPQIAINLARNFLSSTFFFYDSRNYVCCWGYICVHRLQ